MDSILDVTFVTNPDGTQPQCDVFLPATATSSEPAPVLVWWHGGGLLQGTRKGTAPHHATVASTHGLCLVSADSRLPDILADVGALIAWIRSTAFAELTGGRASAARGLVLSGSSAGGWLALMGGTGIGFAACGLVPPAPPTAIVALYPISDVRDAFWHTKQHPVSYFPRVIAAGELEQHGYLDPAGPKSTESELTGPRSIFYHYMVQEGILEDLLLGGTGLAPDAFAVGTQLRTGRYPTPPTFIIHGTIDDKVPISQAYDVEAALRELGSPVEMVAVEGADHLFDRDPQADMSKLYAFLHGIVG